MGSGLFFQWESGHWAKRWVIPSLSFTYFTIYFARACFLGETFVSLCLLGLALADVQAYAAHPEHVKVINDLIKPIMEPGSRAAIQYER